MGYLQTIRLQVAGSRAFVAILSNKQTEKLAVRETAQLLLNEIEKIERKILFFNV